MLDDAACNFGPRSHRDRTHQRETHVALNYAMCDNEVSPFGKFDGDDSGVGRRWFRNGGGVPGCCGTVALDGFLCWLEEFQQKEYRLRRDSYPSFCFNNLLLTNCATLAQETKRIFAIFLAKFKFH